MKGGWRKHTSWVFFFFCERNILCCEWMKRYIHIQKNTPRWQWEKLLMLEPWWMFLVRCCNDKRLLHDICWRVNYCVCIYIYTYFTNTDFFHDHRWSTGSIHVRYRYGSSNDMHRYGMSFSINTVKNTREDPMLPLCYSKWWSPGGVWHVKNLFLKIWLLRPDNNNCVYI